MGPTSNSIAWASRSTKAWIAAAALLGGCAPMTETECRSADWYALGTRDGLAGLQPRVDQYAYQCSAVKVETTDGAYLSGWQHGKWEFDRRVHSSDCCGP